MWRLLTALVALALIAAAIWVLRRDAPEIAPAPTREAVPLPSPTMEERIEFFYELFVSGKQRDLGRQPFPVWKRVGERALIDFGPPAAAYLLSEERTARYGQSPGTLVNVLAALPDMPAAREDPRLYPFLLHWLDPQNLPRKSDRATWATAFRKHIFSMFVLAPREGAAPACLEELRREKREVDLRMVAAGVLLGLGHGAELREMFDRLPPNETEKEPEVRLDLIGRLRFLAEPGNDPQQIESAAEWTSLLEGLVENGTATERIHAAGALMRLGHESMVGLLREEYTKRAGAEGLERNLAWSALILLSTDHADPLPLQEYLRYGAEQKRTFETVTALDRLGIDYLEEADARAVLWRHLDTCPWTHWPALLRLVRVDRERAVAYLRRLLDSGDPAGITEAVRITRRENVAELGPQITEMARRSDLERDRIFYYSALASMRVETAYPLMLADFRPGAPPNLRSAALAGLLTFDRAEGLELVGEALREGDRLVLRTLFQRAQVAGGAGVPERLWPAVVHALRTQPGEDARIEALYTIRIGAKLAQVEKGLQEAYRSEPSRRVAQEIREVLVELAHR